MFNRFYYKAIKREKAFYQQCSGIAKITYICTERPRSFDTIYIVSFYIK